MKITVVQLNPVIGDFEGNLNKSIKAIQQAEIQGADLIVFSELFLTGYPPRDLLEKPSFVEKAEDTLRRLCEFSRSIRAGILTGTIQPTEKKSGKGLYNTAVLIDKGQILFQQPKSLLPNYDVFDEMRYFDPAPDIDIVSFRGEKLGITICEDAWNDPEFWPRREYDFDPVQILADKGATLIVNLSASPFHAGKEKMRCRLIRNHVNRHDIPFVFVNQIGGNDELIFDGNSLVMWPDSEDGIQLNSFAESIQTISMNQPESLRTFNSQNEIAAVHDALVLGIQDYFKKCGFKQAVLGLSGGVDSALVCALAAEALGPDNVLAIAMPSPYSSQHSIDDARALADNLNVDFKLIPIHDLFQPYLDVLMPHFREKSIDTTEENIQARIRGNIVMSFSNKFGRLALSTGNKSELAVGYCTLYGDMSGGLSVISDVPKMMVYALCDDINREEEIIPRNILTKPPSAELKPDQLDQDSLPPYDILDKILSLYVDEKQSPQQIIEQGFKADTVHWIIRTVNINEYKRRQAAPGLKVTTKAFGIGRRMPVAAKY